MRIAVFTDTYFPQVNGVSKYLEEMQKYMDNYDIEYQLFVPQKPIGIEMKNITSFHGMPFLLYPELKISWPSYARIKRALVKFNPDIIYVSSSAPWLSRKNKFKPNKCSERNFRKHSEYLKIED